MYLWGDVEDCTEENLDKHFFDFDSISSNSNLGGEVE